MNIKFLSEDPNTKRVSFELTGTSPAFANALRRTMMDSVPTMAIERVNFTKNNSVLYDEIIAHRLGLVPLTTDLKGYNLPTKCKCGGEGCARCQVKLTLKSDEAGYVSAKEIKSKDPKIKPVCEIPIVKLVKGQDIECECTAQLGTGREHAKWSPCLAWYKYKPVIELDSGRCTNPQETSDSCPVHVFNVEKGKLAIKNLDACHLCGNCVEVATNNSVRLNESESDFVFYIEPWGQLSSQEIVTTALEVLGAEADEFAEAFKEATKK